MHLPPQPPETIMIVVIVVCMLTLAGDVVYVELLTKPGWWNVIILSLVMLTFSIGVDCTVGGE